MTQPHLGEGVRDRRVCKRGEVSHRHRRFSPLNKFQLTHQGPEEAEKNDTSNLSAKRGHHAEDTEQQAHGGEDGADVEPGAVVEKEADERNSWKSKGSERGREGFPAP